MMTIDKGASERDERGVGVGKRIRAAARWSGELRCGGGVAALLIENVEM